MLPLQKGDLISIVSPAKAIDKTKIEFAKKTFEDKGFRVILGQHVDDSHFYFSAKDEIRTEDFQNALENPEVKAIICARGGYGCIRILEKIDWTTQIQHPKWITGFSDITVFHQFLALKGIPSIHATMPLDFTTGTQSSIDSLIDCLKNNSFDYKIKTNQNNIVGECHGKLIGGNLSIVYSLLGTKFQPDFRGKILFLEDVGEALYAIDRMFYALEYASILDQISGIIIGGMTQLKDSEPPFGKDIIEIIMEHLRPKGIPVCLNFPAGHQKENLALILGKEMKMEIKNDWTIIKTI